ncbi:hypothetical protein BDB01DRAFT_228899 [Pilobolus umbonatus]|nr:hypothetical protein BDB01DRAFT_228899 [Pilobolus umbonatus]
MKFSYEMQFLFSSFSIMFADRLLNNNDDFKRCHSMHSFGMDTTNRSVTSSTTHNNRSFPTSGSRRFHASHLGKPPVISTATATPVLKVPVKTEHNHMKSSPLKEVEKTITDLKKENFDLKLRLYHFENNMVKDVEICRLNEENSRLKMELESRNRHMERLTLELTELTEQTRSLTPYINTHISIGTQTDDVSTRITDTSDIYHTPFESSSPEAFGLLPISPVHSQFKEDEIESVVGALEEVKIENGPFRFRSIFDKWLNQNVNDHKRGKLVHPAI